MDFPSGLFFIIILIALTGNQLTTQVCVLTRNRARDPSVHGMTHNQVNYTGQGSIGLG